MRNKQSLHKPITPTPPWTHWAIVLLISFFASPALESSVSAGVIETIQESGGNVVETAAGTIDITASLGFVGVFPSFSGVNPFTATVTVGPTVSTPVDVYSGITGPTTMGSGSLTDATTGTGDLISLNGSLHELGVPVGYVSGSPLEGTATLTGQTFASLGLTPGTYSYTWGTGSTADFFTVNIIASAVPEPASLWLVLIGSVGIFAHRQFGRRKTQKRQGPEGSHGAAK
jgi:PEP-CTERM motif